mgnify:CR=1 FL=1
MNISKMIKKIDEFFTLSPKKQDVKKKKLLKIIEKLNDKKSTIQKEIKKSTEKKEKEKLKDENLDLVDEIRNMPLKKLMVTLKHAKQYIEQNTQLKFEQKSSSNLPLNASLNQPSNKSSLQSPKSLSNLIMQGPTLAQVRSLFKKTSSNTSYLMSYVATGTYQKGQQTLSVKLPDIMADSVLIVAKPLQVFINKGQFSNTIQLSSFKDNPTDIKEKTINEALSNITESMDIFEILGCVSDNMLIFNAGFLLGLASKKTKVVLAGGTQMACVLLVVNSIVKVMEGVFESDNIALCTTKWVYEDEKSDIKALLELLDFNINAYASDFDFSNSSHPALKLYDEGEAKEGVGAGASLCYATLNGISNDDIIKQIEILLG